VKSAIHGATGAVTASTFCLGTIAWGTSVRGEDLDRLYDAFRAAGGNFFDSAHVYACGLSDGAGASERALGEIVRRRGDRQRVILATKGGHPAIAGYPRPDRYLSPQVIASDIRESLDRLGVDSIDLYFLHRDDPRVPVGEIIDTLHEHVARGTIRQLGASNWTTRRIAAANEYAATHGKAGFIAGQPRFSLGVAIPSKDASVPPFDVNEIAWHESSGLTVCAYSSTANGYFATNGAKGGGWNTAASAARLGAANAIAAELRVTPNQIALAWLLRQKFPVIPILGTTKVEHLTDALAAVDVNLSADQVRRLDGDA
jgi:aryl-alcohol dehydrogenase-like predicted oxidoreductase